MSRYLNNKTNCSDIGSQFIILSSVFASIILQEIDSIDDLELLAGFLVALADELALGIIVKSQCEAKLNEGTEPIVEIVLDKDTYNNEKYKSRYKKKVRKKVKVRKSQA